MAGSWRLQAALVALLIAAAGLFIGPEAAGASCVGPRLSVSSGVVAPGETMVIDGRGFFSKCNDTGEPGSLLGDPQTGIPVSFQQGLVPTKLGAVDADTDYEVRLSLRIPDSALPGNATIAVGGATTEVVIQGLARVPAPGDTIGPPVASIAAPRPNALGRSPLTTGMLVLVAGTAGALGAIATGRLRRRLTH